MSNLARTFTEHWQSFNTINSLPQMSLNDFHKISRQNAEQYTANYHGLNLATALQPIFSIDHQRIVGYEALIRASDHRNEPIPPITLLSCPKKEVDNIYLDRLCRYLHVANFQKLSNDNNWLFINVSAEASVKGRSYGLFFAQLLAYFNIEPSNVVVEIIEDPATDNEKLMEAANYYKNMGCMLAIDDFGAGHSNFERIWNLKPDIVKLDRSLLTRSLTSSHTQSLISSLVDLLHEAGCLVVIEGVEDEQQALISINSGADFIQGYYFARPEIHFENIVDKSYLFTGLTEKFITQQKIVAHKQSKVSEQYCQKFRECVLNLQQGLNFESACQPLAQLDKSIRCYITDELGDQLESTIIFKEDAHNKKKFKQLKISENANWFRKHYIKNAIKYHSRIYVSNPYRSITGDGLCITISMSFNILGKQHILCFDIEPTN